MEFTGIHKTAIVHENAQIGNNITVGPYAVIGKNVTIGDNSVIGSHAVIEGYTTIADNCKIFPKAVIGTAPQDLKFEGKESYVKIGESTTIRECVTVNPGTDEGETTKIGSNCLIMAYSHVAHNCEIGNNSILANLATLAGHVTISDCVIIGGMSAVHQFVSIGSYSMVGGCSAVVKDVVPFCTIDGNPSKMVGVNSIGLKRRGFTSEERMLIKKAYRFLFREKLSVTNAVEKIKSELPIDKNINLLLDFIEKSKRGIAL